MGICGGGNGALTGLETAGIIPGSIMAETHSIMMLKAPNTALAQKTGLACNIKGASGCPSSIILNLGITMAK
jgi:hypothetical protein